MIYLEKGYKFTIIYTMSVKEVMRDYPRAEIILIADRDENGGTTLAVKERR